MRFGTLQKLYFGADDGAFSIVTPDERKKGQITITEADGESDVVISAVGAAKIPRQAAKSKKLKVNLWRLSAPSKATELTINYPKASGKELRVYRNDKEGFSYEAGDIWFVFRKGNKIFFGSMPEPNWRSIGRLDAEDEVYTASIYEPELLAAQPQLATSLRYPRSRKLALAAMEKAGWKCEADPNIGLFIARRTGRPYLEPHHLIPMAFQKYFKKTLDRLENICCLSPHHHRRIHVGTRDEALNVIDRLLDRRANIKQIFGVTSDDISGYYNLSDIRQSEC